MGESDPGAFDGPPEQLGGVADRTGQSRPQRGQGGFVQHWQNSFCHFEGAQRHRHSHVSFPGGNLISRGGVCFASTYHTVVVGPAGHITSQPRIDDAGYLFRWYWRAVVRMMRRFGCFAYVVVPHPDGTPPGALFAEQPGFLRGMTFSDGHIDMFASLVSRPWTHHARSAAVAEGGDDREAEEHLLLVGRFDSQLLRLVERRARMRGLAAVYRQMNADLDEATLILSVARPLLLRHLSSSTLETGIGLGNVTARRLPYRLPYWAVERIAMPHARFVADSRGAERAPRSPDHAHSFTSTHRATAQRGRTIAIFGFGEAAVGAPQRLDGASMSTALKQHGAFVSANPSEASPQHQPRLAESAGVRKCLGNGGVAHCLMLWSYANMLVLHTLGLRLRHGRGRSIAPLGAYVPVEGALVADRSAAVLCRWPARLQAVGSMQCFQWTHS